MNDARPHSQPDTNGLPVLDRDVWITCALCCGLGGWEEGRPQHDDPNFAISIKCPSCNGTGWECE